MTSDQGIGVVWAIGWIALVGSALVARGVPRRRMLRMAAIWVAIFAVALLIVTSVSRMQAGDAGSGPLPTEASLT